MARFEHIRSGGAVLAFGTVLLNTLPIWLAELAALGALSDTAAGLLASLVLISSAAACLLATGRGGASLSYGAAVITLVCFTLAAIAPSMPSASIFAVATIVGLSLGVLLNRSLVALARQTDPVPIVGLALSVGLIVSLAILTVPTLTGTGILPLLAIAALATTVAAWPSLAGSASIRSALALRGGPLLPFFVAMGAYWVFLELYANSHGITSVVEWIATSLIVSAAGSALAGRLPTQWRNASKTAALILAAATGGLTYLSGNEFLIGISIQANAFFLFLFFPLYLAGPATETASSAMTARMAMYLLGFAFGGVAGTTLISLGGYPLLAVAIAATALVAIRKL